MTDRPLPDVDALRQRLGGSRDAADSLLALFASDAPRQIGRLREALDRADLKELKYVAHSLKGSLLWLGATAAAEAARALEDGLKDGCVEGARRRADDLDAEVRAVVQAIEAR